MTCFPRAWQGSPRLDRSWPDAVRPGMAQLDLARCGVVGRGAARQGSPLLVVRQGLAGRVSSRLGVAQRVGAGQCGPWLDSPRHDLVGLDAVRRDWAWRDLTRLGVTSLGSPTAVLGVARCDSTWRGVTRRGQAWLDSPRLGQARLDGSRPGLASTGTASLGSAGLDLASLGKARPGSAPLVDLAGSGLARPGAAGQRLGVARFGKTPLNGARQHLAWPGQAHLAQARHGAARLTYRKGDPNLVATNLPT